MTAPTVEAPEYTSVEVADLVGVTYMTVHRWATALDLGVQVGGTGPGSRRRYTDEDLVVAGALALLGSAGTGGALVDRVIDALIKVPARFVAATPAEAHTCHTAADVVKVVLARFVDPVVTVLDLERSTPPVVAALARVVGR
jgi:hypothetical protein